MNSIERSIFNLEPGNIMNHESLKLKKAMFWFFISAVTLQSVAPINSANSKLNITYIFSIRMDYMLHVLMFLSLSVLYRLAYFQKKDFSLLKQHSYFVILLFMAIILEALQLVVPYRTFNINDMAANVLGVIIGIPVVWLIRGNHKFKSGKIGHWF